MSHSHHHHDIDFKKAFAVEKEPGSQVKITGEIPFAELLHERAGAIKTLGKNVKIDGFRAGHVPEAVLVKTIGEMAILAEMAERAIAHMYPHILEEHNIDAIGYPQIAITKIAPENPLGFTATVAVLPTITLPDYKALAKTVNAGKESSEVTDADVDKQINDILRQKAAYERLQKKAAAQAESTDETEVIEEPLETEEDLAKLPIPELTDGLVATLGQPGQFTTVEDFKTKIREHLTIEKKQAVESGHRAKITDAIIDAATMDLPKVLIDSELNQMFAQMNEDLERSNLKMDDYLKHIKKTKEDLAAEWTPAAEKRAKLQLVLNEIAKKEEVKPDQAQLDAQVKQLTDQYKDADKHRVEIYVSSVMTNEAVMKLLENA
ncbi:MAG: trigger factor [Patescibacteria group bacterium]